MRGGIWKNLLVLFFVLLPVWAAFSLLKQQAKGLRFDIVSYSDLPGWSSARVYEAAPALLKSCEKILSFADNKRLPGAGIGGSARDWKPACEALGAAQTAEALEGAIQENFLPLKVSIGGKSVGQFTGYYETLLHGSRTRDARYKIPLYLRPNDLVMVNLGAFRRDLAGRRIAGRVQNGQLTPYADRKAIDGGALSGRGLELLYVDSAVDAFFLHIQGSGRVRMPDGSLVRIGYAAQNGHPYLAIGRPLVREGAIARGDVSMQSIRAWLAENPDRVDDILHQNASYIFFRELTGGDGPIGSANVSLTAGHSLAVDRRYLPMHAPIWLASSHPDPASASAQPIEFTRLMVAQDTGGAINGEIRGDVFWGFGPEAEEIAGRMANKGRYWLLLPKALAYKAAQKQSEQASAH